MKLLKVGARGSPLSLAQTSLVVKALKEANPAYEIEIIPIKTTGDKMRDVSLALIGGKGVFVKELEEALLDGRIDLAVHSAKDMPAALPHGLTLVATPCRFDCRDVLITRNPGGFAALPKAASIGTSGLRRQAQVLALRPDLIIKPIRGNIESRLKKVENEVEATLLAAAGLARLGLEAKHFEFISTDLILPSPGQGALAIEARFDAFEAIEVAETINHQPTYVCLNAERGFLSQLGSGCQLPVAALASLDGRIMTIEGLIASIDGKKVLRDKRKIDLETAEAAANFGRMLAKDLLEQGGSEIMKEAGLI